MTIDTDIIFEFCQTQDTCEDCPLSAYLGSKMLYCMAYSIVMDKQNFEKIYKTFLKERKNEN